RSARLRIARRAPSAPRAANRGGGRSGMARHSTRPLPFRQPGACRHPPCHPHGVSSPADIRRRRRTALAVVAALAGLTGIAAGGRALVMIDQEGGAIRNVPWAPPSEAPPAIDTTGEATTTARATAAGLRRVGVTVNLAPVADVASVPGSVMRTRAFSGYARS